MVDHGQSLSVGHGQFMVNDGRVRLLTMVDHGETMVNYGFYRLIDHEMTII